MIKWEKGRNKGRKVKIVFIIPNMTGGGTERVISLLANEYRSRGIEVAIMMFAGDECAYRLDDGVELFCVSEQSHGRPLIQIKRLKRMRKYFKQNKDCLIYSFSVMGTIFGALATLGLGIRMFVSERNDPRQGLQGPLRNWAYERAAVIAVQTRECMGYFPGRLQKKMMVIPNPVDPSVPEPFQGERRRSVVFVGRLHRQKNPELLLRAFADFQKDYPDYVLEMFGKGELEEALKQAAVELEIEKKVIWYGFCPDVRKRIADAGMYVLSSDFEGISNSMLEAMAMGIPVIATDCPIGGCAEYIQNGRNGLLVPVGDQKAMAGAMRRIAKDPAFAASVSENGSKIREQFPIQAIADQMLKAAEGAEK